MPVCPNCGQFVYRNKPPLVYRTPRQRRLDRYAESAAKHVIAQCSKCGDEFKWLPPNFDMKHRFRAPPDGFCGGMLIMANTGSAT